MSMLVKQTSFVSFWYVLFCVRTNKSCLLAAVAWCEVRPYQGYVQKQKKEPPGSRQVKRTLQTGSFLTSLWGFGSGGNEQCVPVGHPLDQIKPGRFPVCLALHFFFFLFFFSSSSSFFLFFFFFFFFKLPPLEHS